MSLTEVKVEIYCRRCGASNAAGNVSCSSCGTSLKVTVPLPGESAAVSHLAQLAHLLPGQLFQNRYHILSQVGTGGFGAVFKAEDKRTRRLVAIKAIGLQGLSPQEIIEATDAFNREVMLLSDLKHPSIPCMYEQFTDPEHWCLVMEFIEGETLETYRAKLATGCLPFELVLHIGVQLCNVLEYLHSRTPPIIFRDVKPGNIMLTSSGRIYLIDFGVARYFRPGKRKDTIAFGSPGFAAPEQYGKAQTTPRSDIYSLGVTLYQLLSGVDPSLTPFRFVAPRILVPTVPLELDALLLLMMEMDANKRPSNVALVRQELQYVLDKQVQPVSPPVSLPRPKQINFSTQGITRYIHRMHRQKVLSVAWSPDGKHIASASADCTVHVWQAV
ncbi:MAG TPA: protein kinase [Ktedonobacteraceae bacterium]|jgi:serine/threonine protein kinase|nr:protein kinase [Ktedonobacteraceae bacterium]